MNQNNKPVSNHNQLAYIENNETYNYLNNIKKISLKNKVALFAIAIGVIPTFFLGLITYKIADRAIRKQIHESQKNDSEVIFNVLQDFLQERYQDLEIIANLSILTDEQLRKTLTIQQKKTELNNFYQSNRFYRSISFKDLKGTKIIVGDRLEKDLFESIIKTGKPLISQPKVTISGKEIIIDFAAPVRDSVTNKIIGVVHTRISVQELKKIIQRLSLKNYSTYYLVDRKEKVFLTNNENFLNMSAEKFLPSFKQLRQIGTTKTLEIHEPLNNKYIVGTYVGNQFENQLSNLGWDGFIMAEESTAYSFQTYLGRTIILGTIITAIIVSFISIFVANRLVQPIIKAALTVEKIGQGDLGERLTIDRSDELAILNSNINQMADRIQQLIEEQENVAVEQMKTQMAISEQEKQNNEALQKELFRLISSIEDVSSGNLTVRADITESSIGVIADFFNSIIESLRDIVIRVKTTTTQVNSSINENEVAIGNVTQEALKQVSQISNTLNQVEQMTGSIQQVAQNAQDAARVSRSASLTASSGGEAIQKTVDSILELRETVATTTKKVKRLGESSQEISKVVSLINQIAMQTNLLAINASIEASHAGEEGRGFAVVAEEVGELAARSAEATKEIEKIVETIQEETQEVVAAMEIGTAQVVEGTRLVQNTKNSLDSIVDVSREIDLFLQSISSATISQAETSQKVTELMEQVVQVSHRTSDISQSVSHSLETTVIIAQELETSVNTFTV